MKIALIFTNDWELYGDGSGDFFEIQAEPLQKIVKLFNKYNAKMTFFAEVAQQLTYLKNIENEPDFQNVANAWEENVELALKEGHDVQLHLHPQWIDADYEDGRWNLNMEKWSIAKLNRKECDGYVQQAKNYLEVVAKKAKQDYKTIGFRSGSYCTQPAQPLIDCLYSNGLLYDTSVTKGWYHKDLYDFRDAHSNVKPWYFSDNYNRKVPKDHAKMLEFPIYSFKKTHSLIVKKFLPNLYYSLFYRANGIEEEINWQIEKEKVKDKRYPRKNRKLRKGLFTKLNLIKKALIKSEYIQLSYDDLPATVFVKEILKLTKRKGDDVLPVVAIGHTKDIHNTKNLEIILEQLNQKAKNEVLYMSLTEAYNFFSKNTIDK